MWLACLWLLTLPLPSPLPLPLPLDGRSFRLCETHQGCSAQRTHQACLGPAFRSRLPALGPKGNGPPHGTCLPGLRICLCLQCMTRHESNESWPMMLCALSLASRVAGFWLVSWMPYASWVLGLPASPLCMPVPVRIASGFRCILLPTLRV